MGTFGITWGLLGPCIYRCLMMQVVGVSGLCAHARDVVRTGHADSIWHCIDTEIVDSKFVRANDVLQSGHVTSFSHCVRGRRFINSLLFPR